MSELISGILGVFIGSLLSYYLSSRLLRKQSELQFANDFISKNYLPFLSTIAEFRFGIYMWKRAVKKDIDKDSIKPLTEAEASQICAKVILDFKKELGQFINSGLFLLINKIDEELSSYILGTHYRLKRLKYLPEDVSDISEINFNPEIIIELGEKMEAIPLSMLVNQYRSLMIKGT